MDDFTFIAPMKASLSSTEFLEQVDNDPNWAAGEKFDEVNICLQVMKSGEVEA